LKNDFPIVLRMLEKINFLEYNASKSV